METRITKFVRKAYPRCFSASMSELGPDAGKITWEAAKANADRYGLLQTTAEIEAFKDFMRGFGAWSADEINNWSFGECRALFIQFISGDMREAEAFLECGMGDAEFDWDEYQRLSEEGQVSGCIFKGISGEIYFDLG